MLCWSPRGLCWSPGGLDMSDTCCCTLWWFEQHLEIEIVLWKSRKISNMLWAQKRIATLPFSTNWSGSRILQVIHPQPFRLSQTSLKRIDSIGLRSPFPNETDVAHPGWRAEWAGGGAIWLYQLCGYKSGQAEETWWEGVRGGMRSCGRMCFFSWT